MLISAVCLFSSIYREYVDARDKVLRLSANYLVKGKRQRLLLSSTTVINDYTLYVNDEVVLLMVMT